MFSVQIFYLLFHEPKAMDVLTVLLLSVIVILIINNKSSINQKFNELEYRIMELQNQLKQRQQQSKPDETPWKPFTEPPPVKPTTEIKLPEPPKPAEVKFPELPKPVEVKPEPVVERQHEVISDSLSQIRRPVKTWEPPPKPVEEPQVILF